MLGCVLICRNFIQDFIKTGVYPNTSFEAVNQANYQQPEVMAYHMHGLTLAQFLWPDQYERFNFFSTYLKEKGLEVKKYLEVGAGHGLYLDEAVRILGSDTHYEVVDISPTSLEMCKGLVKHDQVSFVLADIFTLQPEEKYDLIVMGELIEHLEDPLGMLLKASELLTEKGQIFLTTPANAPMIDHIYLFKNADDIRDLIQDAGLKVLEESIMYADNMSKEVAERFQLPMMFAGFLGKA